MNGARARGSALLLSTLAAVLLTFIAWPPAVERAAAGQAAGARPAASTSRAPSDPRLRLLHSTFPLDPGSPTNARVREVPKPPPEAQPIAGEPATEATKRQRGEPALAAPVTTTAEVSDSLFGGPLYAALVLAMMMLLVSAYLVRERYMPAPRVGGSHASSGKRGSHKGDGRDVGEFDLRGFGTRLRDVAVGAVSLAVVVALVGYSARPVSAFSFDGPGATLGSQPSLNVTFLGVVMVAGVVYYFGLFGLSVLRERRLPDRGDCFFVLVVPAHNEELVIAKTLESLVCLEYPQFLVLVMNDGSRDATSSIARSFEASGRVAVVDRDTAVAGRGKGAVLNHAFELVSGMVAAADVRLAGRSADEIVVGIVDADGQLERAALARVAPCFADPSVGAVQIGVRIVNARDGLVTRLQDLEFIGFSFFVQAARDRIGSVGLGGNGQFNRLSALASLGRPPWTNCLTEDLDVGLALVASGWRIRFRKGTFVAQQGLRSPRLLLRQRTRWVQGNYQCMAHIPKLLRSRKAPLITRVDLCVYLLMVGFVMVVFLATVLSIADLFGVLSVSNDALSFVPAGTPRRVAFEVMATGPIWTFIFTYQRHSRNPLRWWEVPAYGALFCAYAYLGVLFTFRAWARLLFRRDSWAKTPRLRAETAV